MSDCFISYSRQDHQLATLIASQLRAQNLEVFMDSASIRPGENWREALLRNISASYCFVLIATKNIRGSDWVNQELGIAFQLNKRVLPVLVGIHSSELPGFAADVQALPIGQVPTQRELTNLRSQVAEIVRREKAKGPPEAAALVEQAIKRIEAHAYDAALDNLNQASTIAPLAGDTNYYLALASLKGKRPRSLFLSEADAVSRYLERACTSATPQAHYFYLWAVVKFDFYRANGLQPGRPDVEECLEAAQDYPFDQNAFEQMIGHAEADESLRSLGVI
jgi:hypothetical protein